ncbi:MULTISPECIES: DUF4393 domain-containing protein [Priestia]|uniref:DUF4393 domain-containing protein n=1 Tax=Priestia TaxID=2800373 RepID=UPI001125D229|nr:MULTISPECIES: DUF4393 domain-containing protein [Priestia]
MIPDNSIKNLVDKNTQDSITINNNSIIPNLISSATPILAQIYSDLLSPGVKKVGQALETVLDLSNTVLLPLKLLSEKTKINFKKNLDMYKKKINSIEEEDISQVPPEIGIPILDKLTYVENDYIANLFTNLLACASSVKSCSLSHPGFVNIIENLSVDEARILRFISENQDRMTVFPFIVFKAKSKEIGKRTVDLTGRLTGFEREIELLFPDNVSLYISNLRGMGLIDIPGENYFNQEGMHEELKKYYKPLRNKFERELGNLENEYHSIVISQGWCRLTSYGETFLQACVKRKS